MMKLIVLGTEETAQRLRKMLNCIDVEVFELIDTAFVPEAIESVRSCLKKMKPDISVFTSKSAVKYIWELVPEAAEVAGKCSLAIGPGTAESLFKRGVKNVLIPKRNSSKGIVDFLNSFNGSAFIYSSDRVDHSIEELCGERFLLFKVYRLIPKVDRARDLLSVVSDGDFILLTSASVLEALLTIKDDLLRRNVRIAAISRRIAEKTVNTIGRIDLFYDGDDMSGLSKFLSLNLC
jgi:uroporphyrinogen-III synthase